MGLKRIFDYIENSKIAKIIARALSSYFFPFVTAIVFVACYYLGWEIVAVWYTCICGTAIMVCCKDVSPVICLLLFLNILTSVKHTPSGLNGATSNYFFQPAILSLAIIGVFFLGASIVIRTVTGIVSGRFKITPMFWGMVALCVAFMLSGVFYSHYTVLNFVYGLALSAIILGIFAFACGNIKIEEDTFKKIAFYILIFFAAVTFELAIAYLTYDGIIENGVVIRGLLHMGWGTYNQMGMLLTITIPSWFYLAGKSKLGFLFLLGGVFNVGVCFLSMSRQAMLMSVVVFAACCVWLLIWDKGKRRIINASLMAAVLVLMAIVLGIMHDKVGAFFSSFLQSLKTGSGRTLIWKESMNNFLSKPIFGIGFYDPVAEFLPEISYKGMGYYESKVAFCIPRMAHNTIFQILSSCGLVGLVTYVVHRTQTVISLLNNLTHERVLVAMTMCALLLVCLLDNHIFYFLPTVVYAVLVSLLSVTEVKKPRACRVAV